MKYNEKLKDPRWQKKRLEIFNRDDFACRYCGERELMLAVHHVYYERGREPWEYPNEALLTICEYCHQVEYESRVAAEAILLDAMRATIPAWAIVQLAEALRVFQPAYRLEVILPFLVAFFCEPTFQKKVLNEHGPTIVAKRRLPDPPIREGNTFDHNAWEERVLAHQIGVGK